MISRRQLLLALAATGAGTSTAWPQAKMRVRRIGFLGGGSAAGFATHVAGLRAGLRERGYEEGKNLSIEFRWAEGKLARLAEFARELARMPVDAIVSQGTPATLAAKEATRTIPIIIAAGDAVVTGLVPSLARPGANVTGVTFFAMEAVVKRLELLKEALPQLRRVGVIHNPDNPISREPLIKAVQATAASLKLGSEMVVARSPAEFNDVFSQMKRSGVDAVMFTEDPVQLGNAGTLVQLAAQHRMASIGGTEFARVGCMMAYGVNFHELYRQAAKFVARVMEGAMPGDLPVEQATRFEFIVNVRSAKALGFTLAPSVAQRGDRVIE